MAREAVSEPGLPSPEVRQQILKRAGIILDEARDLMARLDLHEISFPRSVTENSEVLERMAQGRYGGISLKGQGETLAVRSQASGQALVA